MNCIWMEVAPAICFDISGADVTMWATVVIAAFTIGLFVWQRLQLVHAKKVANANYKFALHDKRLRVYFALKEFLEDTSIKGGPSREAAAKMFGEAREVPFIFGDEVNREVQWLIDASFSYLRLEAKLSNLDKLSARKGLSLEQEERREGLVAEIVEIEDDVFERLTQETLAKIFDPYLKLPQSL